MEKNMKKSWFNFKLYLDGLKQLKIIGIMSAVIMACAAFLIPLGNNMNNANYKEKINGVWTVVGKVYSYDIFEMNPFIILIFLVVVPLMSLYLFSFLNKRNACDFYHSIPDSRECQYTSYGAAIVTWSVVLMLESLIISMISAGIFKYVELETDKVLVVLFNIIAGSIFVFGVFGISMSLTGTAFTNIAVAAMILAVPRILATVFVLGITSSIPMVTFELPTGILDDRLNTVTNIFTGIVLHNEIDGLWMWKSFVYTLVVGVVYCILGMFLYKTRKSEVATCAALNKNLQTVLRLIPAMIVCLIPILFIHMVILDEATMDSDTIYMLIVFYVIAVIAYFLYELITTRKLKNLIKAIPGLIWLAIYNVVMVVAMQAGHSVILNNVPVASQVEYVNIAFPSQYYYAYSDETDYYKDSFEEIKYDSNELTELLISELQRNIADYKKDGDVYRYSNTSSENENHIDVVNVTFKTGLSEVNRKIYLTNASSKELLNLLEQSEEMKNALYYVVDAEEISTIRIEGELTREETLELYASYVEELKNLSFEEALNWALGYEDYSVGEANIELKNGKRIRMYISSQVPQTYNMYVEMINEKCGEHEPLQEFINVYNSFDENTSGEEFDVSGDVSIRVFDADDYFYVSGRFSNWKSGAEKYSEADFTENGLLLLTKISDKISEQSGKVIDFNEKYVEVVISINDSTKNVSGEQRKYYPITYEIYEMLKEYGGRG